MTDAQSRLRVLAADCRVRIGTDITGADDEGGSGVWIAPGVVLTCAHVVPSGPNSSVQVGWREHILSGTVGSDAMGVPTGSLWPYPDLAVIVVGEAPRHPCAWLSEAPPVRELAAYGYSGRLGEGLRKSEIIGRRSGSHDYGVGQFWQFKGNEPVSGMSGAPVLDLSSGAVCGIMSANMGEGADGGFVVPVKGLRHYLGAQRWQELLLAHDRFHGQNGVWAALRAQIPPPYNFARCPITPIEEIELLDLLAQFPPEDPEALLARIASCSVGGRLPAEPAALRDVVYDLLDSGGHESDIVMSLLRMTHQLVGSAPIPAHRELYDWATALAGRYERFPELRSIRRAPIPDETNGGVISVEIVSGAARPDLFRLTVTVQQHQRGRRPIYQDQEPMHTLNQVKQISCDQLRTALGLLGGNAQVEFVVPIDLFDEPFDELVPTNSYTNLGRKYWVVLRDYDRQGNSQMRHDWHQRWQRMQNSSCGVRWITCAENLTPSEFSAELVQHPETAIVALTRRPSSNQQIREMLRVALDEGMPAAVWRRGTCPEHDANDVDLPCSGHRFRTAFNPLMPLSDINKLPEAVQLLRNRAVGRSPAAADRDCQGTVLLWDDPARMNQPVAPVREPPYEPLETTG